MRSKTEYLEWETPTKSELLGDLASIVIWKSKCGQYRIGRIDGVAPRFQSVAVVNLPGAREITIQNDMRLLSVALISVEKYHRKKMGVDMVITRNYEEIMKDAEEHGLTQKPVGRWVDTAATERLKALRESNRAKVFEMDEDSARKLLVAVGYSKARKKFNLTKLRDKLNHLDAVEHMLKEPKKQANKNRLEDCLQALARGIKIVIKRPTKEEFVNQFDEDPDKISAMYDAGAFGENPGEINETEAKTKVVTIDEQYPDGKEVLVVTGKASDCKDTITHKTEEPKTLSCLDAAAKVLAESGRAMKCSELVKEMATRGLWISQGKTPNISLNSAIANEMKVGYKKGPSRFKKVGWGWYELV